jgi:hypothetical protein
VFIVQAYHISQYVVTRGGIFLGKWHSSFVGNSYSKMNVQSACAVNAQQKVICFLYEFISPYFPYFKFQNFQS